MLLSSSKVLRNFSMRMMTQEILSFTIAALLAAPLSGTACAQQSVNPASSPAGMKHSIPPRLTLAGVENFGEVTPTLYRGGQPTNEGFDSLSKLGIGIVVDLRGFRESERKEVEQRRMEYVAIPWRCFHPTDAVFARFLALLQKNQGKKVFVHCRLGDDRTGMMIAAYRIAEQGWTAEEARKEMEAFGVSWVHRLICPTLGSYEEKFPTEFDTGPAFRELRPAAPTSQPHP